MKTYTKQLLFLTVSFLVGASLPLILFLQSRTVDSTKNGFEREYGDSRPVLTRSNILDLKFEGYYIAGNTDHHLFLGHREAPAHLLMTDTELRDTVHFNLKLNVSTENKRFDVDRLRVNIDSPIVYMSDGPAGMVLKGNLFSDTVDVSGYDNFSFDGFHGISKHLTVFRTLDAVRGKTQLIPRNAQGDTLPSYTLPKQVDGIFCCDGMLLYDRAFEQLLYVFYYRNQIISLDTLLRERYMSRTIDTVSKAQLELVEINSGRERTFGKIPTKVNRGSCVFGPDLYINSSIRSDNETWEVFGNNSVVDVYRTKDGTYRHSFYLPKYQGRELRYFQVVGQTVFVLYQDHLVTYRLRP
ncbi:MULTISPECIES: hypothetical protein [Flagellimonas]|uniref:Uncharacterized protein n=1 Tax=Flagellimonas olearia TaxID=552546 RepID=A0A444VHZ7_9FLAO|nr:hypothetical protein [Allomuricauda olearia]RYC50386.1 hypothetical protein DN53_05540 [Allomuricauda olearia]